MASLLQLDSLDTRDKVLDLVVQLLSDHLLFGKSGLPPSQPSRYTKPPADETAPPQHTVKTLKAFKGGFKWIQGFYENILK